MIKKIIQIYCLKQPLAKLTLLITILSTQSVKFVFFKTFQTNF